MGLVISILLIILGLCFPKSKYVALMAAIFMVVLFGFNTFTTDYSNYEYTYNNLALGISLSYEPLYELLISFCRILGMPYMGFRLVVGTIYAVLIYLTATRLTHKPAIAMTLYIIVPFLGYISALRSGVASGIIMYAFSCLVCDKKKPVVKFLVGVFIATMFHYSSIVYLLFVLIKFPLSNRKLFYITMGLTAAAAIVIFGSDIIYPIMQVIAPSQKVLGWFAELGEVHLNAKGVLYVIFVAVAFIVLCYLAVMTLSRRHELGYNSELYIDIAEYSLRTSIVMLTFLPIAITDGVYMRLYLTPMLLILCTCAETMGLATRIRFGRYRFKVKLSVCLLGILGLTALQAYFDSQIHYYFAPLFENLFF